jgi:uncharacterized protein
MNTMLDFTESQAEFLIHFLAAPERPEGTFKYQEAAGFLFAVACVPETIPPSEWLPFIFDDQDPGYADAAEAEACIASLMALYNWIADEITVGRPSLPPHCEPLSEPAANFGPDAPLGLWAGGFGAGYDWLEEAWPTQLPREADQELGAVLVTLTFFESREMAQRYMDDMDGEPRPMDEWAADMVAMIPEAMRGYAELAAAVMDDGESDGDDEDESGEIEEETIGLNDPCPCGSGMKYKRCCGAA